MNNEIRSNNDFYKALEYTALVASAATLVLLAYAFIFTGVSLPIIAWLLLVGLLGLAAKI